MFICIMKEKSLTMKENEMQQQQIEDGGFSGDQLNKSEDNFDLSKNDVKKMILKEISVGDEFYPSDIADKYNLDFQTVMVVIDELKENKQVVEKPERHVD